MLFPAPRTRSRAALATFRERFSTILVGVTGATAVFLFLYTVHYVQSTSGAGVPYRRHHQEPGDAALGEPDLGPSSFTTTTTTTTTGPDEPLRADPPTHPPSPATPAPPEPAPPPAPPQSFYEDPRYPAPRDTFCLVVGPEGTGSTWLSELLPATHRPPTNPYKPAHSATATLHELWSSGPIEAVNRARTMFARRVGADVARAAAAAAAPGGEPPPQLAVLHASAPDFNAQHYPDLHSSLWRRFHEAGLRLRLILTYRDPAEAAHSNHRRRWKHLRLGGPSGKNDIVAAARSTEKHMTLLSAQLEALEARGGPVRSADVLAVSYHRLLEDPKGEARRIARYLDLGPRQNEALRLAATNGRRAPSNYTQRLPPPEVAYLRDFFDAERAHKWRRLREATERTA